MARRSICDDSLPAVQAEDCDIVLVVKHYKSLSTKLYFSDGSSPLQVEDNAHTPLAKDIDLAWAELRVVGAHSEEGLDWFIGKGRNLRIDSISSKLYY